MTFRQAQWKRRIETMLARPIVALGWLLSPLFRPASKHDLFIFCPSGDIGGSIMNNADIARLFVDMKPVVIFSKKPKNNQFRYMFDTPGVRTWDLHKRIDNKAYHFVNVFYRGVISRWINESEQPVVLGGESLYFHKVFPWLKKPVKTIELCHLPTWFNYSQQFVPDIDFRVFSTKRLLLDAQEFYRQQGLDESLFTRMLFIDNMIPMPEQPVYCDHKELQVVFIGRGAPQKRVYLIAEAAKRLHEKKLPVHISFVGDVSEVIDTSLLPYATFYGNVSDRQKLEEIQKKSDLLLLTSKYEGLPMTVIEMMALGKAVVSTAINAIPDYIKDGVNGFLIPDYEDEQKIVEDTVLALSVLAADRGKLHEMGKNNRAEALKRFSKDVFYRQWKQVLCG